MTEEATRVPKYLGQRGMPDTGCTDRTTRRGRLVPARIVSRTFRLPVSHTGSFSE